MYYVYRLVDQRNDETFYVGKGKGNRINAHEKEAVSGVESRKCKRIREIIASGKHVGKHIVACFLEEQYAYGFEKQLIDEIGLTNLTNVLPGGQGVWIDKSNVIAKRRRFKFLKSKELARVMSIWLKREHGLINDLPDVNRPFASALWVSARKRLPLLWDEMNKTVSFDDLHAVMKPYGINLLRTEA